MAQLKNVHPHNIVKELVSSLTPRQKQVILKRFGLQDGHRATLEEIGQEWGITRERVRQIESSAMEALRASELASRVVPVVDQLRQHLIEHGDLRREMKLIEEDLERLLDHKAMANDQRAATFFLLNFAEPFMRHVETPELYAAWSVNKNSYIKLRQALKALKSYLKEKNQLLKEQELLDAFERILSSKEFAKLPLIRTEKAMRSWLDISKEIRPNVYGEYGLTSWSNVKPRGVRDMAYLVLSRQGRPMHFQDITKAINATKFSSRVAQSQTVHNELIKDNRFVLVGRGIYALAEWGYQPGIVRDVMVALLKQAKKPLTKEEIIEDVRKQRMVQPNTILLNLHDKKYFKKNSDGRYQLAK